MNDWVYVWRSVVPYPYGCWWFDPTYLLFSSSLALQRDHGFLFSKTFFYPTQLCYSLMWFYFKYVYKFPAIYILILNNLGPSQKPNFCPTSVCLCICKYMCTYACVKVRVRWMCAPITVYSKANLPYTCFSTFYLAYISPPCSLGPISIP